LGSGVQSANRLGEFSPHRCATRRGNCFARSVPFCGKRIRVHPRPSVVKPCNWSAQRCSAICHLPSAICHLAILHRPSSIFFSNDVRRAVFLCGHGIEVGGWGKHSRQFVKFASASAVFAPGDGLYTLADTRARHGGAKARHRDGLSASRDSIAGRGDAGARHGAGVAALGNAIARRGDVNARHGDCVAAHSDACDAVLGAIARHREGHGTL
jgi:hypothetical protein